MITDVGYLAVSFALAASLYAVGASFWGATRNDDRFVQSGRIAATLTFPLILAGALGLWYALVTGDFGVKYVAQVSSLDTPLFFRLTALWGSQNGSILFWNLVMAGFIFFAMLKPWREDKPLLPYVTATMMLILAFFLFINLVVANPFERFLFPPSDGAGLNPLLRHPGMIIHPPMLYAGFTGFIVPFAFCIASLATRRADNLWLLASRRWMLVGWAFLTAGLFLGGRWAHDVLGWGGYWGWDPVENKSLVPWLIGTAFLHSAMIQEKRGMFKNWNVFLMLLTFASVIWGTAVVRSGVLTSVHAFAQSDLGPLFLAFIVVMLVWSAVLWLSRLDTLKSDNRLDSGFSREGVFLLQNVLFVSTALTVFIGTIFPIITEAVNGTKVTVGPPFYNQVAVPQMAALVLLMGVAPLMAWGRASARALGRMSIAPAALTLVSLAALFAAGVRQPIPLILFALSLYTLYQTLIEYGRGAAARVRSMGESWPVALGRLALRNQRRYGGYLIHIGVVLFAIGATGKGFYGVDVLRNIALNDTITVGNYAFTYRGLRAVPCEFNDCRTMQASMLVTDAQTGAIVGALFPHRDSYPIQQHTATIADVTGSWFEEVYVILAAWENNGATASFQIYINPLINLIWLGGAVMILGFLVAFWKAPEPVRAPRLAASLARGAAPSR